MLQNHGCFLPFIRSVIIHSCACAAPSSCNGGLAKRGLELDAYACACQLPSCCLPIRTADTWCRWNRDEFYSKVRRCLNKDVKMSKQRKNVSTRERRHQTVVRKWIWSKARASFQDGCLFICTGVHVHVHAYWTLVAAFCQQYCCSCVSSMHARLAFCWLDG